MFKLYNEYNIGTTPSSTIDETEILSPLEGYRCFGSGTNFTLAFSGTPSKNMATFLLWEASASGTVTIFGTVMPTEFKTKKTLVTCTYDGSAWKVVFNISGDESGYIINANVASNAAIARTKIASGSNNHVVINDGSGVLSSEALLANTRGGTGKDMSADTGVVKVSSGTFSASTITNSDVASNAAIAYSKLATLNTGQIVVGNAGVPTAVTMSGDATIDNTGVVTVSGSVGMFEPGTGTNSLKDKRATSGGTSGDRASTLGDSSFATGDDSVAIGSNAFATDNESQAIGFTAISGGLRSQAIGHTALTQAADDSQALGSGALCRIENSTNIAGPIFIGKATSEGDAAPYRLYAGTEVILMTGTFDAKTLGTQTITFPTGVKMFVDEVGFIATTANTVTGQPELSYGITGNTAALLASTATTGITAAGHRDRQTSLVTDNGVTSLTVEVQVAATGTTLVGRAYFKGFIVEDQ